MTKSNPNDLEEKAIEAIREYFSDTQYSQSQCRRNMRGLIEEIKIMQETLEDDE